MSLLLNNPNPISLEEGAAVLRAKRQQQVAAFATARTKLATILREEPSAPHDADLIERLMALDVKRNVAVSVVANRIH